MRIHYNHAGSDFIKVGYNFRIDNFNNTLFSQAICIAGTKPYRLHHYIGEMKVEVFSNTGDIIIIFFRKTLSKIYCNIISSVSDNAFCNPRNDMSNCIVHFQWQKTKNAQQCFQEEFANIFHMIHQIILQFHNNIWR